LRNDLLTELKKLSPELASNNNRAVAVAERMLALAGDVAPRLGTAERAALMQTLNVVNPRMVGDKFVFKVEISGAKGVASGTYISAQFDTKTGVLQLKNMEVAVEFRNNGLSRELIDKTIELAAGKAPIKRIEGVAGQSNGAMLYDLTTGKMDPARIAETPFARVLRNNYTVKAEPIPGGGGIRMVATNSTGRRRKLLGASPPISGNHARIRQPVT
jgi:hypothetical protein